MSDSKLTQFTLDGKTVPVHFSETQVIKEGVECDLYVFTNDNSKDLAIVRVAKGHKTPLQRVLLGARTLEGLYDGVGTLTVDSTNEHRLNSPDHEAVVVNIGQTMQWHANGDGDLIFYEICEPSYTPGRFEDIG